MEYRGAGARSDAPGIAGGPRGFDKIFLNGVGDGVGLEGLDGHQPQGENQEEDAVCA